MFVVFYCKVENLFGSNVFIHLFLKTEIFLKISLGK